MYMVSLFDKLNIIVCHPMADGMMLAESCFYDDFHGLLLCNLSASKQECAGQSEWGGFDPNLELSVNLLHDVSRYFVVLATRHNELVSGGDACTPRTLDGSMLLRITVTVTGYLF